ncbi:MAG: sulfatase-like hydrolase/transferase, partial [Bacteroides sp.]
HAVDFIKANRNQPFFMYFATNDVHVPRFPHPRFRGKSGMGLRGDAIAQFDWSVGQILKTLDELGLTENTLIILSSDNGPVVDDGYQDQAEELLNGHSPAGNLRGNKYSAFEGGTRVPAIVRWPKQVKRGIVSDALVSQIDWMSSMAALVGERLPKGAAPDSFNYLESWLGKTTTERPWVIEQAANHSLSVRTPEWKYIESNDGGPMITWGPKIETGNLPAPQLYNLKQSAFEKENVAEANTSVLFELQNILRRVKAGHLKP